MSRPKPERGSDAGVTPEVVDREPMTVVGIRTHYDGDDSVFESLWEEFGRRWEELEPLMAGGESFGVVSDFDAEGSTFDYVVGVATTDPDAAPAPFVTVTVPGGAYATFETTLETLEADHAALLDEWLPGSGYVRGSGPEFERYGSTFDPQDPSSAYDYYVPVSRAE